MISYIGYITHISSITPDLHNIYYQYLLWSRKLFSIDHMLSTEPLYLRSFRVDVMGVEFFKNMAYNLYSAITSPLDSRSCNPRADMVQWDCNSYPYLPIRGVIIEIALCTAAIFGIINGMSFVRSR